MANEQSIPQINEGSSAYDLLISKSIDLLQDFSSANWTDYNEHDPGLTIMENLVYALTELNFKAGMPVNDLLIQRQTQQLQSGDNAFYVPSDILLTNPVTINDYRKLIMDRVSNVKNVHITTANPVSEAGFTNIKGLYNIAVELYLYKSVAEEQDKENKRVIAAVKTVFLAHRNLCEDILSIKVYKPMPLEMSFNIQLKAKSSAVEEITTMIINIVNNYLSPGVKFYSFNELDEMDMTTDEIFNGPRLENGFILDSGLTDKLNKIDFFELIKRIAQIPEIQSILSFNLRPSNSGIDTVAELAGSLFIPPDSTPFLVVPTSTEGLVFTIGNLGIEPNLSIVKTETAYLQSLEFSKNKNAYIDNGDLIPQGTYYPYKEYISVRHQFPQIYGIGDNNIPRGSGKLRYAQANQLKGFLLSFDQLMADFLAQLHSLYTIYDMKSGNQSSYFCQLIEDMADLTQLVSLDPDPDSALIQWTENLHTLTRQLDKTAAIRLNQVADDLLSRFGEQIDNYSLHKIDLRAYGLTESLETYEARNLKSKQSLINGYDKLSYNRFKASDYSRPELLHEPGSKIFRPQIPGLVKKIAVLLNMERPSQYSLTQVILDSGMHIYHRRDGFEQVSERLEALYVSDGQESELLINEHILLIDQTAGDLRDTVVFWGNDKTILNETLKEGILPGNYEIKAREDGKHRHYVLFKNKGKEFLIHISKSKADAERIVTETILFLAKLNKKSEGFYLVEHLLLAQPFDKDYFGFKLNLSALDPQLDLVLVQSSLSDMNKRNTTLAYLQENCLNTNGQSWKLVIYQEGATFGLEVLDASGNLIALSEKKYPGQATLQKMVDILENTNINNSSETDFSPQCLTYYGPHAIDESFFTFRMTCILPDWPVRFQDVYFRKLFESTLYEQSPAHLVSDSYWIGMRDMQSFEKIYMRWIEEQAKDSSSGEALKRKYELICFITYLKNLAENG